MELKLPKLRSSNTKPVLKHTTIQNLTASPKQINIYAMAKPRDSLKLPRLDLMNQSGNDKIVQRLYNEIKTDEELKFESLMQTLQFVGSAKN